MLNNSGRDVDDQTIDLGTASSGQVTFTPKAGTALIMWLRGEDATTGESFFLECRKGNSWLKIYPNPDYPVSFVFEKNQYSVGDIIKANYHISNLQGYLIGGKTWWMLAGDFGFNDHINQSANQNADGNVMIQPQYGNYVYAVVEGKDRDGNPIYAESEHLQLGEGQENMVSTYDIYHTEGLVHTAGEDDCTVLTIKNSVYDLDTYDKFLGITCDGIEVEKENYTKSRGSLILTLKSNWLNTLSEGNHKLVIRFTDGSVESVLRISGAKSSVDSITTNKALPKTGDDANVPLWCGMVVFGLLCFVGVLTRLKSRDR